MPAGRKTLPRSAADPTSSCFRRRSAQHCTVPRRVQAAGGSGLVAADRRVYGGGRRGAPSRSRVRSCSPSTWRRDIKFGAFPESLLAVLRGLFCGPGARTPPEWAVPVDAHLITYPTGVGMGSHRDSPYFWGLEIWGISLGCEAVMVFKHVDAQAADVRVVLPPWSIYVMSGQSCTHWTHKIAPIVPVVGGGSVRCSVTLRCPREYEKLAIIAALRACNVEAAAADGTTAAAAAAGVWASPSALPAEASGVGGGGGVAPAPLRVGGGGSSSAAASLAHAAEVGALLVQLAAHSAFGPLRLEFGRDEGGGRERGPSWAHAVNLRGDEVEGKALESYRAEASAMVARVAAWKGRVLAAAVAARGGSGATAGVAAESAWPPTP